MSQTSLEQVAVTFSGPPGDLPFPVPDPAISAVPKLQNYRALQADRIVLTAEQLANRIAERFPHAGLKSVADEVAVVAREAIQTCQRIRRPLYSVRVTVTLLIAGLLGMLTLTGMRVRWLTSQELFELEHFVTTLEAGLGAIFFIGAIVAFLMSLERRAKRERLLKAMRELRALAHIVDMHQLTKDPESIHRHQPTKSSPQRTLTTFLLGRYLDYCSELLSLINKIAAIYVQEFPDSVALESVEQLASLTNGLSRNIWQKIMILDRAVEEHETHAPSATIPTVTAAPAHPA
ncbi:hypothetical protein GC163_00570 [bacterium]|nr:hypothetical protein [bacterium]